MGTAEEKQGEGQRPAPAASSPPLHPRTARASMSSMRQPRSCLSTTTCRQGAHLYSPTIRVVSWSLLPRFRPRKERRYTVRSRCPVESSGKGGGYTRILLSDVVTSHSRNLSQKIWLLYHQLCNRWFDPPRHCLPFANSPPTLLGRFSSVHYISLRLQTCIAHAPRYRDSDPRFIHTGFRLRFRRRRGR